MTGPSPRARGCALSLAVLALLLVGAELGARAYWTRDTLDPLTAAMRNARVGPHPYLAYANRPGFDKPPTEEDPHQITHNALGFRGPEVEWEKPEGVTRVLCLGGSSTYGFGPSSDLTTWPARLEHYLLEAYPERRFEVINAGAQGYSTHESLINLAFRGVDLSPDLVVVYHSINDVRCALYPHVKHDNTHWRANWPLERPKTRSQRLLERSYLYLAWRRYLTDWWAVRQNLGSYVIVDFGKYKDFYLHPDEGDLGFRNFFRNLVGICTLARRHGSQAVLVTQAMNAADIEEAPSKDIQLEGMRRARDILFAVAGEEKIPVIDAAAVLEAAHAAGEPIFTHEVHLQDHGADLLARTIADGIVEMKLLE